MIIHIIMQNINTFSERLIEALKFTFLVFIGYFSPIHDVVHVVLIMFFIDVIYGWRVAAKLRKESFNPCIVWKKTMPRVVLSLLAMILAYVIDTETGQRWFSSFAIIGWSVSALLFMSILKNGYILTQWKPFAVIADSIRFKVKKETGVTIQDSDI